jgi:hypothetical protein
MQQANDRPEALVFVYSQSSHATQTAMTQWSTGLAKLFSQLPGGAGPRYMFIGDLTAGGEEGTQGYHHPCPTAANFSFIQFSFILPNRPITIGRG